MIQVDLITGFLGAGKTTFIKKYVNYLVSQGNRVHIIENEFGKLPVDARLLTEENFDVSAITGGCMCCTGRASFEKQLLEAAAGEYDRIVVEPSGIYDVNSFFSILRGQAISEVCSVGSIITVVDPEPCNGLSEEAQYLLYSQLNYTGAVVMSKVQTKTQDEIETALTGLEDLMERLGAKENLRDRCFAKPWDQLSSGEMDALSHCGCRIAQRATEIMDHMAIFGASLLAVRFDTVENLNTILKKLLTTDQYGKIYRIKGYISNTEGKWYELNCTPDVLEIREAKVRKGLLQVIGQNYDWEIVEKLFLPYN